MDATRHSTADLLEISIDGKRLFQVDINTASTIYSLIGTVGSP